VGIKNTFFLFFFSLTNNIWILCVPRICEMVLQRVMKRGRTRWSDSSAAASWAPSSSCSWSSWWRCRNRERAAKRGLAGVTDGRTTVRGARDYYPILFCCATFSTPCFFDSLNYADPLAVACIEAPLTSLLLPWFPSQGYCV
jgi:hypothetical protein